MCDLGWWPRFGPIARNSSALFVPGMVQTSPEGDVVSLHADAAEAAVGVIFTDRSALVASPAAGAPIGDKVGQRLTVRSIEEFDVALYEAPPA